MTHPELANAVGTVCVVPKVRVSKAAESVVARLVRSSERVDVLQFVESLVQMATDDVRRRERLSFSRAEQETQRAVASELFEERGNRRMKVNLTQAPRRLEALLDLAQINLPQLLNQLNQRGSQGFLPSVQQVSFFIGKLVSGTISPSRREAGAL